MNSTAKEKAVRSLKPNRLIYHNQMVRLAGFEPTTPWFVAKYSIQLSYRREARIITEAGLAAPPRIGPPHQRVLTMPLDAEGGFDYACTRTTRFHPKRLKPL